MVERIEIEFSEQEQRKLIREVLADLHYAVGTIVENASELIPGEAVEELNEAWETSQKSISDLVTGSRLKNLDLRKSELEGKVGKIKRSMLLRFKDRFFYVLEFATTDGRD